MAATSTAHSSTRPFLSLAARLLGRARRRLRSLAIAVVLRSSQRRSSSAIYRKELIDLKTNVAAAATHSTLSNLSHAAMQSMD